MAWRSQGITGSNNIPLGKRRFGGEPEEDGVVDRDLKRGRDPEPRSIADGPRQRKKRSRWGEASENKAAGLMGLPTAIMSNMTSEQLEAYTLHLRIEEISQKLRIDDVVPADGDRYATPTVRLVHGNLRDPNFGSPSDRRRRHRSTTTMVDVSTPASTDTASVSRTSATNSSKGP